MEWSLPKYDLNIKKSDKGPTIFDRLRKRWVALTPEEWVRQNFVEFLISEKQFPEALMGNEISLSQNGIKRRCDTLVADRHGNALVIVEYKQPNVEITQEVFDQIVRYNSVLKAKYLIVSNGISHYCCTIDYENHSHSFLPDIPMFENL